MPKQHDAEALLAAYSEPVENYFAKVLGRDFQCFGCSAHNDAELGIRVYSQKEPKGAPSVLAHIPAVGRQRTSFPGLVHGGVLSSIADDVAYWTIFHAERVLALTVSLNIRFTSPASAESALLALGTIKSTPACEQGKPGMYEVAVDIFSAASGRVHASGTVAFFAAPDQQLQAVFGAETFAKLRERL